MNKKSLIILLVILLFIFTGFVFDPFHFFSTSYQAQVINVIEKIERKPLLPSHTVVAYYGNFYSKNMGVLGEYPTSEIKTRLKKETDLWQQTSTSTLVVPAIHYIAVTAQGTPGDDGKYRLRMPGAEIDKAITLANEVKGLTFLDIQVGLSNVKTEVPLLLKYLKMNEVHLAIDPEFSMKGGQRPGTVIGTMDAEDINYVSGYLADIVKKNNLTPKILVVHRFTQNMLTNYQNIIIRPEVQIVIDMDGWGPPENKINTYTSFISKEPVEFTGFKLFYKNDLRKPSTRLLKPEEILKLDPVPSYIQYQ